MICRHELYNLASKVDLPAQQHPRGHPVAKYRESQKSSQKLLTNSEKKSMPELLTYPVHRGGKGGGYDIFSPSE